jgi:hypothetical protein
MTASAPSDANALRESIVILRHERAVRKASTGHRRALLKSSGRVADAHARRCELVPDCVSPRRVAVADQGKVFRQGAVARSDYGSRGLMHDDRINTKS